MKLNKNTDKSDEDGSKLILAHGTNKVRPLKLPVEVSFACLTLACWWRHLPRVAVAPVARAKLNPTRELLVRVQRSLTFVSSFVVRSLPMHCVLRA